MRTINNPAKLIVVDEDPSEHTEELRAEIREMERSIKEKLYELYAVEDNLMKQFVRKMEPLPMGTVLYNESTGVEYFVIDHHNDIVRM